MILLSQSAVTASEQHHAQFCSLSHRTEQGLWDLLRSGELHPSCSSATGSESPVARLLAPAEQSSPLLSTRWEPPSPPQPGQCTVFSRRRTTWSLATERQQSARWPTLLDNVTHFREQGRCQTGSTLPGSSGRGSWVCGLGSDLQVLSWLTGNPGGQNPHLDPPLRAQT